MKRIFRRLFRASPLSVLAVIFLYSGTANADFGIPYEEHAALRVDAATVAAVDGDNTAGTEYTTAEREDVGGSSFLEAQVFFKRIVDAMGNETLRVYFSVHDESNPVSAPLDGIRFYFDQLHNHGTATFPSAPTETLEDVEMVIFRSDCGHGAHPNCSFDRRVRSSNGTFDGVATPVNFTTDATVKSNAPGEYAASPNPLGWTGEFELTPSDLGWSAFPPVFGLLVRATSENQNNIGSGTSSGAVTVSYPFSGTSVVTNMAAGDWSNFKSRYPLDFGLVMDYSGSMTALDGLADNRWVRAKRAADLFVDTMSLFKDDYFDDQVAIMQYSWSCSGNDTTGNTTGNVDGLSTKLAPGLIPSLPPGGGTISNSYTDNNATNPPGNNCTPIQQGLTQALRNLPTDATPGMYGAVNTSVKRDRILVLLSDGFHNMPPMHSGFNTDQSSPFTAVEKGNVPVRTVAMGPDASTGTALLSGISTAFNGGLSFTAKYNNPLTFPELINAYMETVMEPLKVDQVANVGAPPPGNPLFNPGGGERLVFIGVWDDVSDAGALSVTRDSVAQTATVYTSTAVGYTAVVVDNPTSGGSWDIVPGTGVVAPDQEYAFIDPRPFARFLIEQKDYGVGDEILLQVDLKDRGLPVLNARATVEVAKPGEALGDFLSTVQNDCSRAAPRLPPLDVDPVGVSFAAGVSTSAGTTSAPATTAGGDPIPGRYALAAAHMDRCNIDTLVRDTLPGVQLFDDGSHGDLTADDGVYSRAYNDTDVEGSYTFRFHVRGTTDDGMDYSRTRTTAQYLAVKPNAASSDTGSQVLPPAQQTAMQTARVFVLPKSGHSYLGPGFGQAINLSVNQGSLAGGLIDHQNGYYSQTVRYECGERPRAVFSYKGDTVSSFNAYTAYEIAPFIGRTFFDSGLGMDDGIVLGLRLGLQLDCAWSLELEGGVTGTEDSSGEGGRMLQALINARYDMHAQRMGSVTPYVSGGLGMASFQGFADNDDALAAQLSVGGSYDVNYWLTLRAEARALWIDNVYGASSSTNSQTNFIAVFSF